MFIRVPTVVFLALFACVAFAAGGPRDGMVAPIEISSTSIQWRVQIPSDGFTLRITRPDGETYFVASPSRRPMLTISDLGVATDGSYAYELIIVPPIPESVRTKMKELRAKNDEAGARRLAREIGIDRTFSESGSFTILNGGFVVPAEESSSAGKTLAAPSDGSGNGGNAALAANKARNLQPALNDQVIPDDLIVQQSLCVGFDCVNGESFGFDTIRLKENNTRIKFEDTSVGSFPTNDWQLTANDSASGGANKFSIEDVTGLRVPFTITAGASTNSVFIDSIGRVGFRTSTPVLDLHVATSNTPGWRLEQNSSGGFSAQTWDVAGNEANFFIRDVTSGSRLPFCIRPGAPTSSLDIAASGNVGIGTGSPTGKLHVVTTTGGPFIVATDGKVGIGAAPSSGVNLEIQGPDPGAGSSALGWRIANTNTNNLAAFVANNRAVFGTTNATPLDIITNGSASVRMTVATNGNVGFGVAAPTNPIQHSSGAHLTAGGAWTNASSRELKKDISALGDTEAMSALNALNPVKFTYKADPAEHHVGFIAEEVPEIVATADRKGLSAMDVVAVLTKVVQEQQKTIDEMKKRIEQLEQPR